jgi:hypothetical protein
MDRQRYEQKLLQPSSEQHAMGFHMERFTFNEDNILERKNRVQQAYESFRYRNQLDEVRQVVIEVKLKCVTYDFMITGMPMVVTQLTKERVLEYIGDLEVDYNDDQDVWELIEGVGFKWH